jgi:hypothetical protein
MLVTRQSNMVFCPVTYVLDGMTFDDMIEELQKAKALQKGSECP